VPKDAIGILWLPLYAQEGGPKIFLLKITSANPAFCSKSDETFLQTVRRKLDNVYRLHKHCSFIYASRH
jgi:hypothetical protein